MFVFVYSVIVAVVVVSLGAKTHGALTVTSGVCTTQYDNHLVIHSQVYIEPWASVHVMWTSFAGLSA